MSNLGGYIDKGGHNLESLIKDRPPAPKPLSPPPRPAPLPTQKMEIHFTNEWLKNRIENDPDIECDAGPELTSEILQAVIDKQSTPNKDTKMEIKEETVTNDIPERKVFTIDTGNLTDEQAMELIEKLKKSILDRKLDETKTDYRGFVLSLLSETSKGSDALIARIKEIEAQGINPAMLVAGALGICGEGAEVGDLVKKVLFQGKELDRQKMVKELGDLRFYAEVMYNVVSTDDEEVKRENMVKLLARYPNGFKVENSENRKPGDV